MEKSAVAFCPGKITGYFLPVYGDSPANTGSLGACAVIDHGVTTKVIKSRQTSVTIHDPETGISIRGSAPLEEACLTLGVTADIRTESRLPLHSGYGLSAAALLSSISALNAIYDLEMSRREIAMTAHRIEVEGRTGLGDVAALAGGGLACRKGPGIDAEILRIYPDTEIYAVTSGELKTGDVLSRKNLSEDLMKAYPSRCPGNLDDFIVLSRQFAEDSGMISNNVRRLLETCDRHGIPAGMTMLGEGVFAIDEKAPEILSRFGRVNSFRINDKGFGDAEVNG